MAGSKPSDFACEAAAGMNSVVATITPGMPSLSSVLMSCKLHDVHEPQSASPSTTMSASLTMAWTMSCAAFFELLALR